MKRGDRWVLLGVIGIVAVLTAAVAAMFGVEKERTALVTILGFVGWGYACMSYWQERARAAEELAKAASRAYGAAITAKGGWALNMDADLNAMSELVTAIETWRAEK